MTSAEVDLESELGLSLDRVVALGFMADAFSGENRRVGNALGVVASDVELSLIRCLTLIAEIKASARGAR
ncbi:hypothetical protein [Aureimonas glaciei]|uniref:Uncharacterized protein n=1 Tax=Aureimonas glaciei TaxID=1776957 RepID=A0A917DK26_9HYPH|nr:hypothetical protein [Aureimonas glaciei]GGD42498.1 hypothetical protein GCM10011335_51490 [Aureimonas glaciei]